MQLLNLLRKIIVCQKLLLLILVKL